jgi:hypothetical protein
MALADPQSIKISGTTTSLPRVSTGDYRSKYESSDGNIDLTLSSQFGKRKRQVVRVDVSKIIASALVPTTNEEASMSLQLVVDRPLVGYDNADAKAVYDGFIEALQASSSKIITQLLAGES